MSRRRAGAPYADAPTGELGDPLLPRWFVLLAVASVPVALAVAVAAFVVFRPATVAVAERRPPPAGDVTNDVGALVAGERPPAPVDDLCPVLAGIAAAGTDADRTALGDGARALCAVDLPEDAARRLRAFADAGGVLRFAQFEATGVDSTAALGGAPPVIYLNARFARTEPSFLAPLLVHDTTFLELDPALASSALAARAAEAGVCEDLFEAREPPRGCADAAAIVGLDDPLAALRDAGFR